VDNIAKSTCEISQNLLIEILIFRSSQNWVVVYQDDLLYLKVTRAIQKSPRWYGIPWSYRIWSWC